MGGGVSAVHMYVLLEAPCSTTKEERKKGREENNQSDLAL